MAMAERRAFRRNLRRVLGLVVLLAALTPGRAAAAPIVAPDRIFDRQFDVWFGTLTVAGAPGVMLDFVELTDRLSDDLIAAIDGDASVDARVRTALSAGGPWSNAGQTGIEWVLGSNPPPDNFPAQANLANAYAAAALALFGPGSLTLLGPGALLTQSNYLMGTFQSIETAPVVVGDTDNPFLFGNDGDTVLVNENFVAEARYFQQDAVWTPAPAPIPEPGTIGLTLLGLAGLRAARRRRR
jgi:hypothetical protein